MTGRYPRRFGKYVLLKPLAKGGMGEIYLAVGGDIGGFEKFCVIKKVLTEKSDRTKANRFLDEAKVVLRLAHSALVTTFDAGDVDGEFYIAMELVEGKDLREVWNRCVRTRQRIPLDVALHVVREVARALAYVHAYGDLRLVHRDVAPPNILLAYVGDVKLTDFGLARSILKQEHTAPGVVFGRAAYLAPEQARGEIADARTDIYTLGIVLWELLTGQQYLQLSGLDPAAALAIVRHPKVAPPSSRAPWIPAALDQVVMRALTADRADRFASAEDMRRSLSEVISEIAPRADSARVAEFLRGIYQDTIAEERAERDNFLKDEIPKFRAGVSVPDRTLLMGAEQALAAVPVLDPDPAQNRDAAPAAPAVFGLAPAPLAAAPVPADASVETAPTESPPEMGASGPTLPSHNLPPVPLAPRVEGGALPALVDRGRTGRGTGRAWAAPRLPGLPPTVAPVPGESPLPPAPTKPSPLARYAAVRTALVTKNEAPLVPTAPVPTAPGPSAEPDPEHETPPSVTIMGRYRLLGPIGEGTLGTIYAARHVEQGHDLALRLVAAETVGPTFDREKWRRDVRTVSSLKHAHSVEVFDLGTTEDGSPYVAMEPLAGMDLATYLKREQRLDPVLAVKIALPLCNLLAAAHASGVIHGALRPESIFVVPRGKSIDSVKLIDFGLGDVAIGDVALGDVPRPRATPLSLPAGIAAYLCPEQIEGAAPDALSDVYGVGVILYELLTGAPPHVGSADILGRRSQEAPQSPRMFRPDISEALERITMAALFRDRDRRPGSMAELEAALGDLADLGLRGAGSQHPDLAGNAQLVAGAQARGQRRVTREAAYRAIAELSAEPALAVPYLLPATTLPAEGAIDDPADEATTDPTVQTLKAAHVVQPVVAPVPTGVSPSAVAIPLRPMGGSLLARYGAGSQDDMRSHKRWALAKLALVSAVLLAAGMLLTDSFSCADRGAGNHRPVTGAGVAPH